MRQDRDNMGGTCVSIDPDRFGGRARNFSILAAAMVVLIHAGRADMPGAANWWLYELLAWGVCTFAVPGFFMISGFFLAAHFDEPGWWGRALLRRARTLLVPYLIWDLVYSVCTFVLTAAAALEAGRNPLVGFSGWDWLVLCLGLDPFRFPKLIPLWYVRCLLLLVLMSPVLARTLRRTGWWIVAALFPLQLLLCGVCDRYDQVPFLFYGGPFSLAGLLYFQVGILLRRNGVPAWLSRPGWKTLLPLGLAVAVAGRILLFQGQRAAGDCCWGVGIPLLLGGVWRMLPETPGPRVLVSAAFPVYLLHLFNVQVAELLFSPHTTDWWAYPVRAATVFAVSVAEASLIRRHEPTARLLFGGR